jgi:phenylacetate-CoA ligase
LNTYSRVLESILIPGYYGLRSRSYPAYRKFLEQSQWWTAEQIEDFQWRELRRLLEHAFRTVPYYRKKYSGINCEDIQTRKDFAKLPPLTRAELNEHRAELCSTQPGERLISHATGGSSGVPARFFITRDSFDWRCAATARAYSWSGCVIGERTLYLWGAPVGELPFLKRAKLNAYRFLRREMVVPTFSQTVEMWRDTASKALRFKPAFMVGYVSSLDECAKYLLASKTSISSVRAVLAAAEPLPDETRQLVQKVFGAPVFDTYGSREFMSIAAECDQHEGMHLNAENVFVETEQPATIGPSELLITDLHNYGMPFIRYRIGDVGSLNTSACSCGRGLPKIQVEGRARDVLRTRDGRVVSGIFFPHTLKDIPEVREFQAQQVSLDEITLSVVLNSPLSDGSRVLLRQEIGKVFGSDTQVKIESVDKIPRLLSGKRQATVGCNAQQTIR